MTHPEIIVSRADHSASEEVAQALVSKAAYDAVWEQNAALLKDNGHWRVQAADVLTELHDRESQLGQAHEQLLLAQADVETLVTTIRAFFRAPSYEEAGRIRVELHQLARAHPSAALTDEVALARAESAAARPLAEEARRFRTADCDCSVCLRIGALLAAYDATQAGAP